MRKHYFLIGSFFLCLPPLLPLSAMERGKDFSLNSAQQSTPQRNLRTETPSASNSITEIDQLLKKGAQHQKNYVDNPVNTEGHLDKADACFKEALSKLKNSNIELKIKNLHETMLSKTLGDVAVMKGQLDTAKAFFTQANNLKDYYPEILKILKLESEAANNLQNCYQNCYSDILKILKWEKEYKEGNFTNTTSLATLLIKKHNYEDGFLYLLDYCLTHKDGGANTFLSEGFWNIRNSEKVHKHVIDHLKKGNTKHMTYLMLSYIQNDEIKEPTELFKKHYTKKLIKDLRNTASHFYRNKELQFAKSLWQIISSMGCTKSLNDLKDLENQPQKKLLTPIERKESKNSIPPLLINLISSVIPEESEDEEEESEGQRKFDVKASPIPKASIDLSMTQNRERGEREVPISNAKKYSRVAMADQQPVVAGLSKKTPTLLKKETPQREESKTRLEKGENRSRSRSQVSKNDFLRAIDQEVSKTPGLTLSRRGSHTSIHGPNGVATFAIPHGRDSSKVRQHIVDQTLEKVRDISKKPENTQGKNLKREN